MKKPQYIVIVETDKYTSIENITTSKSKAKKSFKDWIDECWKLNKNQMSEAIKNLDYSQNGQRIYIKKNY